MAEKPVVKDQVKIDDYLYGPVHILRSRINTGKNQIKYHESQLKHFLELKEKSQNEIEILEKAVDILVAAGYKDEPKDGPKPSNVIL